MPAPDFENLPTEYQDLLRLANEKHQLEVAPLQELKGGRSGAFLYLASVSTGDSSKLEHFVVKFDRVNEKAQSTEVQRHRLALSSAPAEFADRHLAELAYEVGQDGAIALFYTIAGQSLQNFRTLASQEKQSRLEQLFSATTDHLLRDWNSDLSFDRTVHPQELLERWLRFRLQPGGQVGVFLEDVLGIDPDIEGFLIQDHVFPNPWRFGLDAPRWEDSRAIDVATGFQHSDLNTANILASFSEDQDRLDGYFFIDFALFKDHAPLFFDQCYLEMSYLLRELERVPLQKWASFVGHFASRDIPNPKDVPVELAGVCTVINAGRRSFEDWLSETHPSLSDDIWGQFWLAAVAAGMNFCGKSALSMEERMAGLIYSAVHLKRYCSQFGVTLPVDVRPLYAVSSSGEIAPPSGSIRIPDLPPSILPVQPSPFIGRTEELLAVKELLAKEDVRLVTLTGPGGTGKTRLALETAHDLVDQFDDGAYFIDLAPIREPEPVLDAIGRTVGLKESSDQTLLEGLKELLHAYHVLLLLDNFEQVTAAAPHVAELLQFCPQLEVIATSREALRVSGEHLFPVPPLTLPDGEGEAPDKLTQFEAIALFVERAKAAKPDFVLTADNAEAVVEICTRLDGLPLAIELATARINLFPPAKLLERLASRLTLLRGGARDLPARHQALRDTIEWSYELLPVEQQRLFALLSVFPGCAFEAVEGVAGGIEHLDKSGFDALEGLASLVDKSLIRMVEREAGMPRLLMLETIREYATEHRVQHPEFDDAARVAHARYFADFTQQQWERPGGERETALKEMELEIENLRLAWRYWVADANLEQLHKLTDGLWLLYNARGWYHAMVELTNDLLTVLATTPSTQERIEQEIMLRTSLARALMAMQGATDEVREAFVRALELCEGQGEIPELFPVLRGLASFYLFVNDLENSARMGERILRLAEIRDDDAMRVEGHLVLGATLAFTEFETGLEHLDKGIAIYDPDMRRSGRFRLGNDPGVVSYTTSALILWTIGYPDQAHERAEAAVDLAKRLNHPNSLAYALFHAGFVYLRRRDPELVKSNAKALLKIAEEHDFQIWRALATCLNGAALAQMGRAEEGLAASNWGMDLYQSLKTPPAFWPMLIAMRAAVLGQAGQAAEGVALLEQVEEVLVQAPDSFMLLSELYRLKGDLLLSLSENGKAQAESLYLRALELAKEGSITMFELQAAMSLCRLWQAHGKSEAGRQVLSEVYERLTEGFSTADLREAQALLADLG